MKGVVKPHAAPTRRKPATQRHMEGEDGGALEGTGSIVLNCGVSISVFEPWRQRIYGEVWTSQLGILRWHPTTFFPAFGISDLGRFQLYSERIDGIFQPCRITWLFGCKGITTPNLRAWCLSFQPSVLLKELWRRLEYHLHHRRTYSKA